MNGHIEVIRILVNHEGINLNLQGSSGSTALHLSCDWGHQRVIRLLLEKGADPTIALNNGRTPLDIARLHHEQECIALLEVRIQNMDNFVNALCTHQSFLSHILGCPISTDSRPAVA